MCGIFAYIQDTIFVPDNEDLMNGSEHEDFIRMSQEGSNRGPESSSYITLDIMYIWVSSFSHLWNRRCV